MKIYKAISSLILMGHVYRPYKNYKYIDDFREILVAIRAESVKSARNLFSAIKRMG
jgi:predicted transcriptional regulator